MAEHGYEKGRLNLPFVGHCTFGKQPACLDWDAIDADIAVLGAPFDMGTQYRAGARFGPRAIREASTLFSFGHDGAYDFEDDVTYMPVDKVRLVDIGDADMIHTDTIRSHEGIELGVRKILAAKALPVVLGVVLGAAVLMVSALPFRSFKDLRPTPVGVGFVFVVGTVGALLALWIHVSAALAWLLGMYVALALVESLVGLAKGMTIQNPGRKPRDPGRPAPRSHAAASEDASGGS